MEIYCSAYTPQPTLLQDSADSLWEIYYRLCADSGSWQRIRVYGVSPNRTDNPHQSPSQPLIKPPLPRQRLTTPPRPIATVSRQPITGMRNHRYKYNTLLLRLMLDHEYIIIIRIQAGWPLNLAAMKPPLCFPASQTVDNEPGHRPTTHPAASEWRLYSEFGSQWTT